MLRPRCSEPPARKQVIHGGADTRRFTPVLRRRPGRCRVRRAADPAQGDRPVDLRPARWRRAPDRGPLRPRSPSPERDYPALLRRLAQGQDVTFLGPVPDSARPACTDEPRSWPSPPSTVPATAGTSPCGSCSAWWRLRAWPVGPRWSPAGLEAWPRSFSGSPGGPVPSDAWPPTRRRRSAGALRAHGRVCRLLPAALPYSCLTAAKAAVSVSATGTPVASSACR